MAREEAAPETSSRSTHAISRDDSSLTSDEEGALWLDARKVYDLFRIDEKSLSNYARLGSLHPRHIKRVDQYAKHIFSWFREEDTTPVYRKIVVYNALEIVSLERYDNRDGRRGKYLPQQIKNRHAEVLDAFVSPVEITLLEFRVRYGYRCKKFRAGWRVDRADGTFVCSGTSPQQAWKAALQLEQGRLAPILIARDAIIMRQFAEARAIADQLKTVLAEPLRREIVRAETAVATLSVHPVITSTPSEDA